MSEPIAISQDLTVVVRDWLLAHRPAGIPEAVEIRAAGDTAPVERPYFVVLCENVRNEGGVMVRGDLVLRMRTQVDEQTAAAAAGWHMEAVRALNLAETFSELQAAMQVRGYWLRLPWVSGDYEDAKDGRRGRKYEQRWRWCVQTELP